MCYEDIKLGLRRWTRTTAAAGPLSIAGDKTRVAVRLSLQNSAANDGGVWASLVDQQGASSVMSISNGKPTDEIWIERHGSLVQLPLSFTLKTGDGYSVTEIFDNSLYDQPQ